MREKLFFLVVGCFYLLFVSGCAEDEAVLRLRAENKLNLLHLTKGMTKKEVLLLMGEKNVYLGTDKNATVVGNPYKIKMIKTNDHEYEVLYYYTDRDQKDWPFKKFTIYDHELTPLIFENGSLVGWGDSYLQSLTK